VLVLSKTLKGLKYIIHYIIIIIIMDLSQFVAVEETPASTITTGVSEYLLKIINPTNAQLVSIVGYEVKEGEEKSYIYKNGTMGVCCYGVDATGKMLKAVFQLKSEPQMREVWSKSADGTYVKETKDGQPLKVQLFADMYGRTNVWDNESKTFVYPTEGYKMHEGEEEFVNFLRLVFGFNDRKDAEPITIKFKDSKSYIKFIEGKANLIDSLEISVPKDKWKINKVWIHLYGEKDANGARYWSKVDTVAEPYWSKNLSYWENRFTKKMNKRLDKCFYPGAKLTTTPMHEIGTDIVQSTLPINKLSEVVDAVKEEDNDLPF
jgi:hypothetical protein